MLGLTIEEKQRRQELFRKETDEGLNQKEQLELRILDLRAGGASLEDAEKQAREELGIE